ncbi:hypothetical protein IWQ48_002469 [Labrenzia sp. EL_13]|nr:hypothetical protein [Labrenzia sp. EL_142]MBG6201331.1 hypothetical protein [Labrenzia sp. EL_13]
MRKVRDFALIGKDIPIRLTKNKALAQIIIIFTAS